MPKAVNVRFDDDLIEFLDFLVTEEQGKLDAMQIATESNYSTVLRGLLKSEIRRRGDAYKPKPKKGKK